MVLESLWTIKDLFVYPNEYIYWGIPIVMYPFMTGLVAGAFVLSSLYHLFDVKALKDIAGFSLVLSFALLLVAPLPLLMHLGHPERNLYVILTPHFTSAIAAFGVVLFIYAAVVASELWFLFRKHFVNASLVMKGKADKSLSEQMKYVLFKTLTLGAADVSEAALKSDAKAIKILAGAGVPIACFLHGYAGFVFGSVKANALWMTPLMPVIFIMSAIVSGVALCLLVYIIVGEMGRKAAIRKGSAFAGHAPDENSMETTVIRTTVKYLIFFMIFSISLELLDLVFRSYTAVKSWDILRHIIYGKDMINIFILQYVLGNLVPLMILLFPGRLTKRRVILALVLVIFGVFMMRWNVVIGGQSFSLTFSGFMDYRMPIIPRDLETFKQGLGGALMIAVLPFIFFGILNKIFPVLGAKRTD